MSLAQRLSNIHGKSQDAAEMYFRQNLQNLQALHMRQEKPKDDARAGATGKPASSGGVGRKTPFIRSATHTYTAADIEELGLEAKVRYPPEAWEAIAKALNSAERSAAVTTVSGKLMAPGQKFCEELHLHRGKAILSPLMQLLEGPNTNMLVTKRLFEYTSLPGLIAYQCHVLLYDGHRQPFLARITLVPLQPAEVCKDLGEEIVPNADPLCICWLERLEHEIDSDSACVLRQRHRFWYRFEHKVLYFQTTVDQFIVAPHCVVHAGPGPGPEKALTAVFHAVPVINIQMALELGQMESVPSILKAYMSTPEKLPPRAVRFHEYSARPDLKGCIDAVLKRGLSFERTEKFLQDRVLYIRGGPVGQLHLFPSVLAPPAPRAGSPSRPSCFSELPPSIQEIVTCLHGIERPQSASPQQRLEPRFSLYDDADPFLAFRGHTQVKLCDWFQHCLLLAMAHDLLPPMTSSLELTNPSLSTAKLHKSRCNDPEALNLINCLGLEVGLGYTRSKNSKNVRNGRADIRFAYRERHEQVKRLKQYSNTQL